MSTSEEFAEYLSKMHEAGIEKLDQMRDNALAGLWKIHPGAGPAYATASSADQLPKMLDYEGAMVWVVDESRYYRRVDGEWVAVEAQASDGVQIPDVEVHNAPGSGFTSVADAGELTSIPAAAGDVVWVHDEKQWYKHDGTEWVAVEPSES